VGLILLCVLPSVCKATPPQWTPEKWESFLSALRQTETGGQPNEGLGCRGDGGDALGPFQIHRACFTDAVQYDKSLSEFTYEDCLNDMALSRRVVRAYVNRYSKRGDTVEDMARLWNSGPNWKNKKSKTDGYVKRFKKFLDS
jgi:hypothetical protein